MRYKKGTKVEVLTNNEVPSRSWRCAEIVSGNGHNYIIRYDVYPGVTDEAAIVERVTRKSIRPCPPPVELAENWVPGDVVEVFQNLSWKMATVSKVLIENQFLVRLVGSLEEFEASKFDLRVRQSWQNDEWIVIGEDSRNFEDGRRYELSTLKYNQSSSSQVKKKDAKVKFFVKDHCSAPNNNNFQESRIVSSKTLKRGSPCCYSQVDANEGIAQKFRVAEKEGRRQQVLSRSPEKVDAVATTREMLCEKHVHNFFDNKATHFSEMNVEREKPNGAFGFSRAISLNPNDANSVTCSVGSCSISSHSPYKLHCRSDPIEDIEGSYSDAESFCEVGYQEGISLPPTNEELAAEIHRLELHAYRCTMEALHASGPLSWEKETMVTNLRMSLHISNDEHLMELKNLVSAATCIPYR